MIAMNNVDRLVQLANEATHELLRTFRDCLAFTVESQERSTPDQRAALEAQHGQITYLIERTVEAQAPVYRTDAKHGIVIASEIGRTRITDVTKGA